MCVCACVQSLEALVNRMVREVTKDRPEGVSGYLTSQLLARLRKVSLSLSLSHSLSLGNMSAYNFSLPDEFLKGVKGVTIKKD